MSDLTTGIVELGQGVLTARALEPAAGETLDGHTHEQACLNCGTALLGSHCHACGQAAHVHRSLGAFFHDLAHGVLHVEGKIWHTLPLLAWRPGRLTREYIDGRRASYLSPIALFLFAVFVLFAVIHLVESPGGGNRHVYTSMNEAITNQQHGVEVLREQRADAATPAAAGKLDREIAEMQSSLDSLRKLQTSADYADIEKVARDGTSSIPWINHAIRKFQANRELALYKLQMSAYKYSWLLIPISVPLLWLLFPFNRRFKLYDHTVFVTYSLASMTLLAVVLTLGNAFDLPFIGAVGLVVPPVHMYRQLKGTYGLGRGAALWRTLALLVFAATALLLFAAAILSMGLGE